MFCPNCGNAVEDSAVNCPHCGNKMSEEEVVVEETVVAPVEEVKAEKACQYCGAMVPVDATICPVCNQEAGEKKEAAPAPAPIPAGNNIFAILGLIGAFVWDIAGLILSIIGLKKAKTMGGKGKGMAMAGLIISIARIALAILAVVGVVLIYVIYIVIMMIALSSGY